ncbi:MAG TPA: hypothetical protein VKY65_15585 [Alphaproteobacteria bacterium]|nr:hypothetical protein [Alphaproteobacteria bacterium]
MTMALWRTKKSQDVVAGSAYRHTHEDFVETAQVLAICQDQLGIPHVRYMVSYARRDRKVLEDGPRILSLAAFTNRFREPATA